MDGKHVFSVIAAVNVSNRLEGIFGGFLRKRRRFVLDMSAYAYQEGRFVSSGQFLQVEFEATQVALHRTAFLGQV